MNSKLSKLIFIVISTLFVNLNLNGQVANKEVVVSNNEDSVYTNPDILPIFPGGTDSLYQFIKTNLVYPQMALENRIEGYTVFKVIIEKDGSISHITQARKIGWMMDEEALKLIKQMPKWTPGKVNDNPVRCHYVLKITFEYPINSEN